MKKVSLIIPCCNEEDVLPIFWQKMSQELKNTQFSYEILFIDDGSKDNTLQWIKDKAKNNKNVKYISFSRNFGKEAAMFAGLQHSDGDYVAILDADLQDPPSLLPQMLGILEKGEYDSVATRRKFRKGEPPIRSCFATMFYKIMFMFSKLDIRDGARDFRLMKRNMVQELIRMCEHDRFIKAMFSWVGFKTYWLEFDNVERSKGISKWSFFSLLKYSLSAIFNYSNAAINIVLSLAVILTAISIICWIFLLFSWNMSAEIFNFRLLLDTIISIGAILLWAIWLVGIYAAKTYIEVQNRPHYIIAQTNKK